MTQTGSFSWNPGYNSTNNRMTGSSYDSDGHVLYDGLNTYTWDGYGKMYSVTAGTTAGACTGSAFCVTYDAFGRAVEMYSRGEWLYSPIGKVAWMTGQTVNSVYVQQPGGGTAVNGNGTLYFLHPDWLGTKRLSTLVGTGAEYFDTAYAPFGQQYDSFGTLFPVNFTGDYQDIFSPGHLYDTPNRELSQNAGRWLSPDPAGASWNAYSYPTDPNRQTDPSGALLLPDQHPYSGSWGGSGDLWTGVDGGYCMLDFVQTGCSGLAGLGSNGIALCSQCKPGQFVDANNQIWQWISDTTGVTPTDAPPVARRVKLLAYWGIVGAADDPLLAVNNGNSSADPYANAPLSRFLRNLIFRPWSIGILLPLGIPAGPAASLSVDLDKGFVCLGVGGGVGGRGVNGGPLWGDTQNSREILSGWSVSVNVAGPVGAQIMQNLSGKMYGPTGGSPGVSLALTYSWCSGK